MSSFRPFAFFIFAVLLAVTSRTAVDHTTPVDIIRTEMSFSFVYDGKSSRELIKGWKRTEKVTQLDGGRSLRATAYTDPQSGLEVIAETTSFPEHNAVEWLLRMHNAGSADTALIQDIRPMDLRITDIGTRTAAYFRIWQAV
jgi:hypothetical protein